MGGGLAAGILLLGSKACLFGQGEPLVNQQTSTVLIPSHDPNAAATTADDAIQQTQQRGPHLPLAGGKGEQVRNGQHGEAVPPRV